MGLSMFTSIVEMELLQTILQLGSVQCDAIRWERSLRRCRLGEL